MVPLYILSGNALRVNVITTWPISVEGEGGCSGHHYYVGFGHTHTVARVVGAD